MTTISMLVLLAFLGFLVLYRDKTGTDCFFDTRSTGCMRGIWCIIIVLVHIPEAYQNPIQDLLGSFAYVGVTFFFMTSGYGLTLSAKTDPVKTTKGFWQRRLPKLLMPMLLVNILRVAAAYCATGEFAPLGFLHINGFVRQLLLFYFLFWLVFRFLPAKYNTKCAVVCICVLIFSIAIYCWETNPLFSWPAESFGFLYGVLLACGKERFVAFAKKRWLAKSAVACALALVLGVMYLKFKNVTFFGDYMVKTDLGFAILLFILLLTVKFPFGNRISGFFGSISYEIYLLHDVIFLILINFYAEMNAGIFVVASLLLTAGVSVLVHKLSKTLLALGKNKDK